MVDWAEASALFLCWPCLVARAPSITDGHSIIEARRWVGDLDPPPGETIEAAERYL